jgi:hypothetical protein
VCYKFGLFTSSDFARQPRAGTMLVGVKVTRPFVKPHGVGARPTPAANFTPPFTIDERRELSAARKSQKNPRERKSYETRHALSKPIALSQELQTESCDSNPASRKAEPVVPSIPRWSRNQNL